MRNNDLEWRIATDCTNQWCPYRKEVCGENAPVPPVIMPSTLEEIKEQEHEIWRHKPVSIDHGANIKEQVLMRIKAYKKLFCGMLYATHDSEPRVVKVPLRDGVTSFKNWMDLDVNHWVNQKGQHTFVALGGKWQKTATTVPNSATAPAFAYKILLESPCANPPPNLLVESINAMGTNDIQHEVNILIMKMKHEDEKVILDMAERDKEFTTFLLKA